MNQQIQCIPTAFLWVPRLQEEALTESLLGMAGTPGASASDVGIQASGSEGIEGLAGTPVAVATLFSNLDHGTETESIAGLAGSVTPIGSTLFVFGTDQSDSILGLAGSQTVNSSFIFVEGPASSESILGLAGSPTASASQP